jgi:CheY-like chemotaxis protein
MSSDGLGFGTTFYIELPLHKKIIADSSSSNLPSLSFEEKSRSSRKIYPMYTECSVSDRKLPSIPLTKKNSDREEKYLKEEENLFSKKQLLDVIELDENFIETVDIKSVEYKPSWETGLTFLTVDDSLPFRKMTNKLLSNMGHTVQHAVDGIDFLEKLNIHFPSSFDQCDIENTIHFPKYDVILIDNNMPNMCGPEATKIARAHGYKGIIFGVTGNVNKDQIDDFMEHGVDDVFSKPLNMESLAAAIKRLLTAE